MILGTIIIVFLAIAAMELLAMKAMFALDIIKSIEEDKNKNKKWGLD